MSDAPGASRRPPSTRMPRPPHPSRPLRLALTQGDPAGIGPEILLGVLTLALESAPAAGDGAERSLLRSPRSPRSPRLPPAWQPLLVAERAALDALRSSLPGAPWDRLHYLPGMPQAAELEALAAAGGDAVPVLDPVAVRRTVVPGNSGPADAAGAMAALDAGIALVRQGVADALVTAPVAKESIARHLLPDFRGHTDYLAAACGLERYGRDYLMAFLAPDLQVALLTVHLPLAQALAAALEPRALDEALACLERHAGGRIALAGLNPHAGEGGLLGGEDQAVLAPAVERARRAGLDVHGPESADSLFARARRGEFDWVLALYHDQGLIAVKTAAFGLATNWTLGLPFLRTSVDHGTAFHLAGRGLADARPLAAVIATTLALAAGELPRRRPAGS
ncbi:MAG TPA: 4-hydroxythreonine-4-phosphate dehydrogenase PdxA [Thermoanaerobaculia bacterium]|nr:4-hydroxythreonine-4-phosphate dehydrogenase PdxA [Thermoanaerobaculia bacterium]